MDRKKKSHYNSRVSLHEAPTKNILSPSIITSSFLLGNDSIRLRLSLYPDQKQLDDLSQLVWRNVVVAVLVNDLESVQDLLLVLFHLRDLASHHAQELSEIDFPIPIFVSLRHNLLQLLLRRVLAQISARQNLTGSNNILSGISRNPNIFKHSAFTQYAQKKSD